MTGGVLTLVFEPGLFTSAPVRTAAIIGGAAAAVSGAVGVFTVIRGQSFSGHALAEVSSAGGAAAFLLDINPLLGFLAMGALAAFGMGAFRVDRLAERDLVTGIVNGAGLGLAALLLYLDVTMKSTNGATVTVMFGSMFAISRDVVPLALAVGVGAVVATGLLYRPLLLCSLDADLAAARGVPVRLVSLAYLLVVAMAVSLSAITVGAILSTALLIGPPAIALHWAKRPGSAMLLSAGVGAVATWGGIIVAYDSFDWTGGRGWPVSFCIVAIIFVAYLIVAAASRRPAGWVRWRPSHARRS